MGMTGQMKGSSRPERKAYMLEEAMKGVEWGGEEGGVGGHRSTVVMPHDPGDE